MLRTRTATALLLAGTLLAGCMSREEKLIDRRHQLRETLDELYETYSSPERAGDARGGAQDAGLVGRLLAGVDRAHFDEYCLALGRGERPFAFSAKLEGFMKTDANARTCRRAAELEVAIAELEREIGPSR